MALPRVSTGLSPSVPNEEPVQPNANALVAEALALPSSQRPAFVETLRQSSPKIATEVEELLEAHESVEAEGFLGNVVPEEPSTEDKPPVDQTTMAYSKVERNCLLEVPSGLIGDDYELLDELGAGGMGTVYRAFQRSLNRHVALKIIPSRLLRENEQVARFYLEAEAAARLDHPGIVSVQDVGEENGVHYYAMALVEGGSLAQYVGQQERLSPRRVAEIMELSALAVQHAHDRAVIHRDIKPANIMLDKEGQPRITDFGLAKIGGGDELTMTGQVMGTPSYMAPEQAEGKNHAISTRTDVYSLGATLYALLSGKAPFAAETVLSTLQKVQKETPAALSQETPADLRTICEKCLAKLPEQRYTSAAALAEDLRNYLDGYPISARPIGVWLRTVRWTRRNPLVASLLGTIATILLIASVVSTTLAIQAQRALERAEANAQKLGEAIEETFVFASEDVLANEPGMQAARKTLLESAERYYQGLIETGHSSERELANTSYLLGKVQVSLGQWKAAGLSLSNALSIQKIRAENPNSDALDFTSIALTCNELAKLAETRWNRDTSSMSEQQRTTLLTQWRQHADRCAVWRTKAVEADPSDDELKRLLANAKMNHGWAVAETARAGDDIQQLSVAHEMLRKAQSIREEILGRQPTDFAVSRDLALGLMAEADLTGIKAELAKEKATSNDLWQRSLALRTKAAELLEELPLAERTQETQWRLATCYQVCGNSRFHLGLGKEAIVDFQKMLTVLQRLMLKNPNVIRYRTGAASAQFNLSQLLLASGDDSGYAMISDFQYSLAEAIAIAPDNPATLVQLEGYTEDIARSLAQSGLLSQALQQIEQAIELLEELPAGDVSFDDVSRKRLSDTVEQLRELDNRLVKQYGSKSI